MILSDAAIRNRATVFVLISLITAAGAWSYHNLPLEAAPDVQTPFIIVSTIYEGVSPADVESSVTNKIETQLTGLKGVKEIRSASVEGMSIITIEFLPTVKVDSAMQYVRDKLDLAKRDLPTDIEEPALSEFNIAEMPILMVNISGDISPWRLKLIGDDLEDAIEERIPEVLNVDVLGGLEREIRLLMLPDRVAMYRLSIPELVGLVPSEHVNISAGGLDTPGMKFNVRVPGEVQDPGDIDGFMLTTRNGKPIYLTDVAQVRDTFKDRTSFSRLDGDESITISVQKRIGANIVDIVDKVNAILAEARKIAPKGVKFEVTLDQSEQIRMMNADLENNIYSGLILVVGVLVIFMGLRSSLVVGLAIPLSMLLSFVVLAMFGYTLNMIVLFSLILALGMLVDNAIVIVENIYRHMSLGRGRIEAAMKGTSEVAWPVISSTATTVAAFLPLLFWPGIMGDFMKYLPITLIITLTSSLVVALVISPVLCSIIAGGKRIDREGGKHHPVIAGYRAVLKFSLDHWWATLASTVLVLAGMVICYAKWGYGVEFFPDIDPRYGVINIRSPQGTSVEESDRLARAIERRLLPYRKDLKHLVSNVGASGGADPMVSDTGGPHIANITLVFPEYEDRMLAGLNSSETLKKIRADLTNFAGAEIKVEKQEEGPPTGAAVTARFIGKDNAKLQQASETARKALANNPVPGLVNLRSDWVATRPELAFHVNRRRAVLMGVSAAVIGNFLKTALFGREVGKYRQFIDEYDITLRLPLDQRERIEDLLRLRIPGADGTPVPLSSVGEFIYTGGMGTIRHVDAKPVITLTADAEGRQGNEVLADVQKILAKIPLPSGVELRYAGEKEEQDAGTAFLLKAFMIALGLIVVILIMQFNTFSVPLIIMTTVVLSLIGVLAGLLICRMPFGIIMTGVGVISLAGVVVNNAIVLLDYTRLLQRRGKDIVEATIEAGATRLRPVFLTAVTTILGLVPMAVGISFDFTKMRMAWYSESSQWWASMAIAVIFGLGFATILTLVVVPTLYLVLYRAAAWRKRILTAMGMGWMFSQEEEANPTEMEDF